MLTKLQPEHKKLPLKWATVQF